MKYELHPAALQKCAEAVQFFTRYDQHQDFIDTIETSIDSRSPRPLAADTAHLLLKYSVDLTL